MTVVGMTVVSGGSDSVGYDRCGPDSGGWWV